jgi:hypothetical protein
MAAKSKGMGLVVTVVIAMLAIVGMFGYALFGSPQQSAISSEQGQQTLQQVTQASNKGNAATVTTAAFDHAADGTPQVATHLFVESYTDGAFNGLLNDNTTLSATAKTSVSTAIGDKLKVASFLTASYYGEVVDYTPLKESGNNLDLRAWSIANPINQINVDCYDDGSKLAVDWDRGCNITVNADQTNALDSFRIEVNASNVVWRLKGIGFNLTSTSNLDDVRVSGAVTTESGSPSGGSSFAESTSLPKRLRNNLNLLYVVEPYIQLNEFDAIRTSSVQFEASSTNPSEGVFAVFIDEGLYKSTKSATLNKIMSGLEDDASTEVDVGGADVRKRINVQ